MAVLESCPLCSSMDIRPLQHITDYSVSSESFWLAQCNACQFTFTQDAPAETDIARYYRSEAYVSHSDSTKGLVNWLYHQVRKHTINNKRRLIAKANKYAPGAILDYGSGTGAFLAAMKASGWDAMGLEPDETARANASRIHQLSLSTPDMLPSIPDARFDIITLWHVLEHVHQLQDTLAHLYRVLKPGGHIVIAVPNHVSRDAKHYGQCWAAWDLPRHLWHFTPATMRALLSRHKLHVVETRPMWFDSFYVSMLSEKYATGKVRMMHAFIQGLLSNIQAYRQPETCSSLIYIAEKRS